MSDESKKLVLGHVSPAKGLPEHGRQPTWKPGPLAAGDAMRQAKLIAERWRRQIQAGTLKPGVAWVDDVLLSEMELVIQALTGG